MPRRYRIPSTNGDIADLYFVLIANFYLTALTALSLPRSFLSIISPLVRVVAVHCVLRTFVYTLGKYLSLRLTSYFPSLSRL